MNGRLLDQTQAAAFLGVSTRTLRRWLASGDGPVGCTVGRSGRVYYRAEDLLAFTAALKTRGTAGPREDGSA